MLLSLFCVTMLLERFRCGSKKMLILLHQGLRLVASRCTCRRYLHHGVFFTTVILLKINNLVVFSFERESYLMKTNEGARCLKKESSKGL